MSESLENADTALTIVPAGIAAAGAIGSRVAPKRVRGLVVTLGGIPDFLTAAFLNIPVVGPGGDATEFFTLLSTKMRP